MRDAFARQTPELLAGIRDAIARKDAEALASHAHKLKGSMSYFPGERGVDIARNVEQAARAGDAVTALSRGDIAEFKRGRAFLQSKIGHLR